MENGRPPAQRWLDIAPERIEPWLASFAQRHGAPTVEVSSEVVTFRAPEGSVAECHVPFPPLPAGTHGTGPELARHALADRTVAVLLVRLGGYAAGVFGGSDARLLDSKVGNRLVHGRTSKGGSSQHRFARRREKQAREALEAAADCAATVFGRFGGRLDAVVLGGDRRAMAALRADTRLRPYFEIAVDRFLSVPDPRLAVLKDTPRMFCAVRVRLTESATRGGSPNTA
jgi:Actinobacteria/chloroflexi VLRF1 release factor